MIQAQIVSSSFNEFVAGKSVQQSLIWFLANSERYQDQTSVVCWHFSFFVQKILHLICKNRLFNELLREEPVDGWMSKQNLFHQIFKQYFCFHIETTWVPLIKCTLSLENISKKSFNLFLYFHEKRRFENIMIWPIKNRRLPSKLDNWQLVHALQVTFNATFQV